MVKKSVGIAFAVCFALLFSVGAVSAFEFNGTVKDENGNFLNNSNVTITVKNSANWQVVGYNRTTTNASGWFNLSIGESGGMPWMYEISINHWNGSFVSFRSKSIPTFPQQQIQQMAGAIFYLAPAGTINISVVNASGGRTAFRYQIKDTKIGYPIAENFNSAVNESVVYVPRDRNYSIMVYPEQSMPISFDWNNFSSSSSYEFGISSYNATTRTLNKQFNTTMNLARVSGYAKMTGISGWDSFSVVPLLVEPGNMIHSSYGAMPYNMSAFQGESDIFDLSTGFYNISLPATVESSTIMLFATARNGTNYYGGFKNISLSYPGSSISQFNLTMAGLFGNPANISVDEISMGPPTQRNISTAKQSFYMINASNASISNASGHIEVKVDYSSFGAMEFIWMADISQQTTGATTFAVPILNNTGIKEMNIFLSGGAEGSSQYAPRRVSMSVSEITSNNNITIRNFDAQAIDTTLNTNQVEIELYISNSTCDVPNPADACLADGQGETMADFNPMRTVMGGGKISFRMGYRNISVHYVNVDLIASGPPEALFESTTNNRSSGDAFSAALRFGSGGPTIYEYVLVSIPYFENTGGLNDSAPVNISIPLIYDDNWNIIWNASANGSDANALAGNYSHYSSKASEWGNLLSQKTCTTTNVTEASQINSSSPCYIDIANNKIWVRLPHFSGTGPQVTGTSYQVTTVGTNAIAFENPTETTGTYLNRNYILANVTANLTNQANITINLYNTTGLVSSANTTAYGLYVNFSGLSDSAYFFNATARNNSNWANSTETRNVTIDRTNPLTTINLPANAQNLTSRTISINLTVVETNIINTTIVIANSTGSTINSTYNTSIGNYNISLSVGADGIYAITATTYDLAGNTNSSSKNITIDTTAPTITAYSPVNNTNYYANQSIIINFAATDALMSSTTRWYNYNETTNITFSSAIAINYTTTGQKNITFYANDTLGNLATLNYLINITTQSSDTFVANDTTYAVNSSVTNVVVPYNSTLQNVTLTNTSQRVTFDLSQLTSNGIAATGNYSFNLISSGTYNYTAYIPANMNITGGAGWDGKITMPVINTSTFTAPTLSGYTTATNVIIDLGASSELNFSSPVKVVIGGMAGKRAAWSRGSASLTDISTQCNNITNPTNINSSISPRECYGDSGSDLVIWTYHFTSFAAYTPTATTTEEEESAGGSLAADTWIVTYTADDAKFKSAEGYTKTMIAKSRVKLAVDSETHYVGVLEISSSKVKIEVSSTPQTAELSVGQSKKFELTGDNYYDVEVTLNSIKGIQAELNIKSIHEEKAAPAGEKETPLMAPEEGETEGAAEGTIGLWIWIGAIVLVIAGIIVALVLYRRKRKHNFGY